MFEFKSFLKILIQIALDWSDTPLVVHVYHGDVLREQGLLAVSDDVLQEGKCARPEGRQPVTNYTKYVKEVLELNLRLSFI